MKITLSPFERKAILDEAKKYEKRTGDTYSIRFVMLLLAEMFSEQLESAVKEVFEEKIRLYEEEQAGKEAAK